MGRGGGNHSQYCWPLKTKHAAFGEGCDAATRLRQATLRRGAARGAGAAGVTIRRLTVSDGRAVAQAGAGLKLTRQPPPGWSAMATSVEQPWQSTDAGTWQLYWPAADRPAQARVHGPATIISQTAGRPNTRITRNIAPR
jgi:hypothetical protein